MSLLIDIGNTRIKVGYADADGIRQPHHTIALTHAELSQLPLWLNNMAYALTTPLLFLFQPQPSLSNCAFCYINKAVVFIG